MKKTHKIIMLPTEKVGKLWLRQSDSKLISENNLQHNSSTVKGCQHLYILSDEEITEGDWITDKYRVWQWKDDSSLLGRKKIVATTDESLKIGGGTGRREDGISFPLPQIPESFIKDYIKAHNKGKPITEVDLETEERIWCPKCPKARDITCGRLDCVAERKMMIKTRPDNTVIIHQCKTYSKEDMEKAFDAGLNHESNPKVFPNFSKWIQNL